MSSDTPAARAATLASAFDASVRRVFSAFTVEMTPADPWGAVRHVQQVRLLGSDGSVAVLGHVNLREGWAELRTLGHTLAASRASLGRELRLPPREYLRFLEIATGIFSCSGLHVTVAVLGAPSRADAAPREAAAPESSRSGVRRMTLPYGLAESAAAAIAAGAKGVR